MHDLFFLRFIVWVIRSNTISRYFPNHGLYANYYHGRAIDTEGNGVCSARHVNVDDDLSLI